MSEPFDWTRFTVRINIHGASTEQLYNAWATRSGMEFWFLRQSEYKTVEGKLRASEEVAGKGDQYKWLWHGWPDETVEHGKVIDCNGTDYFYFSFGKAGNCAVTIKEEHGEKLIELVQDSIPADEYGKQYWHLGCKTGWTFYLANLKSLFEGGKDLRNRNLELRNVVNS